MRMKELAAVEVVVVFGAVILYIWRLQNVIRTFPFTHLRSSAQRFFCIAMACSKWDWDRMALRRLFDVYGVLRWPPLQSW